MAAQQAEFEKAAKEHKEKLDGLYKEIGSVARALRQSKLQSRRPSRVASSVSSRVPSPTGSTREVLTQAGIRLKRETIERNLRDKQRSNIERIRNLELPKTEKKSPETSEDEDGWTSLGEEIPLNWEAKQENGKAALYNVNMAIKESQRPKCTYVCPEEECYFMSSR